MDTCSPRRARGTAHWERGAGCPSGKNTSRKAGYSASVRAHSSLVRNRWNRAKASLNSRKRPSRSEMKIASCMLSMAAASLAWLSRRASLGKPPLGHIVDDREEQRPVMVADGAAVHLEVVHRSIRQAVPRQEVVGLPLADAPQVLLDGFGRQRVELLDALAAQFGAGPSIVGHRGGIRRDDPPAGRLDHEHDGAAVDEQVPGSAPRSPGGRPGLRSGP